MTLRGGRGPPPPGEFLQELATMRRQEMRERGEALRMRDEVVAEVRGRRRAFWRGIWACTARLCIEDSILERFAR